MKIYICLQLNAMNPGKSSAEYGCLGIIVTEGGARSGDGK